MAYTEDGFLQVDVKPLITWNGLGGDGCITSDRITKEDWKVGYMFREEPMPGRPDSGWRFLKGDEDDEYMSDAGNHHVFSLNTICNYDENIIPYLDMEVGSVLIRISESEFMVDDQSQAIFMMRQER